MGFVSITLNMLLLGLILRTALCVIKLRWYVVEFYTVPLPLEAFFWVAVHMLSVSGILWYRKFQKRVES